jgi:hypothetical protein
MNRRSTPPPSIPLLPPVASFPSSIVFSAYSFSLAGDVVVAVLVAIAATFAMI